MTETKVVEAVQAQATHLERSHCAMPSCSYPCAATAEHFITSATRKPKRKEPVEDAGATKKLRPDDALSPEGADTELAGSQLDQVATQVQASDTISSDTHLNAAQNQPASQALPAHSTPLRPPRLQPVEHSPESACRSSDFESDEFETDENQITTAIHLQPGHPMVVTQTYTHTHKHSHSHSSAITATYLPVPGLPTAAVTAAASALAMPSTTASADASQPPAYSQAQDAAAAVPMYEAAEDAADEEEFMDFDPLLFIKQLPPLESCVPAHRPCILPKQTRKCKKKTLVLDLDETLVHSSLETVDHSDFNFPVMFNNQEHTVFVRERPHLHSFMARVAELFDVVVFTASQKIYAEKLLNILDPERLLVKHRIYRDSCVIVDGNYLKDLTILGRDLRHTIIVDNSPQAFGFQVENGVPIESWYEDEKDEELVKLLPFLESLVEVDDVRPMILKQYRLRELIDRA